MPVSQRELMVRTLLDIHDGKHRVILRDSRGIPFYVVSDEFFLTMSPLPDAFAVTTASMSCDKGRERPVIDRIVVGRLHNEKAFAELRSWQAAV